MQTVNEIFDILLSGKKLTLTASCQNDPEIRNLLNHLNVLKSNTKKMYKRLDFAFDNKVIRIEPKLENLGPGSLVTFSFVKREVKKFSTFTIEE